MKKTLIISTIIATSVLFIGAGLFLRSSLDKNLEVKNLTLDIKIPKIEYKIGEPIKGEYHIKYDGRPGRALILYGVSKRSPNFMVTDADFSITTALYNQKGYQIDGGGYKGKSKTGGFTSVYIINSQDLPVYNSEGQAIMQSEFNFFASETIEGEYVFSLALYDCLDNEALIETSLGKKCNDLNNQDSDKLEIMLLQKQLSILKSIEKVVVKKQDVKTIIEKPAAKPAPIKSTSVVKDCGKDFNCMIAAAKTCSPAKTSPNFSYKDKDNMITIVGPREIKGKDSQNSCVWSLMFSRIDGLDIAEAQVEDEEAKAIIANMKKIVGTETICKYPPGPESLEALSAFFVAEKNGELPWMFLVGLPSGADCATTKNGTPFQF
ncbi:MAG: hypothetical protein AAB454_00090 [Patescibacteria group bacterium]